jgi:hypothetical protein
MSTCLVGSLTAGRVQPGVCVVAPFEEKKKIIGPQNGMIYITKGKLKRSNELLLPQFEYQLMNMNNRSGRLRND